MPKVLLSEKLDDRGLFWLPAAPSHQVPGRVSFEPYNIITVELSSSLAIDPKDPFGPQSAPIMLGRFLDGELITLIDSFVTSQSLGPGLGMPNTWTVNRAIVGAHVLDPTARVFSRINIRLTSLDQWFCDCPFQSKVQTKGKKRLGNRVEYRFPETIRIAVPRRQISIDSEYRLDEHCTWTTSVSLEHKVYLRIAAKRNEALDPLLEHAWHLQNLLSLLVGEAVTPIQLVAELGEPSIPTNRLDKKVDLLLIHRGEAPKRTLYPPEMILPLGRIRNVFGRIVRKWFERVKESELALNVFFGSLYQPSDISNLRFLTTIQAIESYHRSLGAGLYMAQSKFNEAIIPLLDAIPPEIKDDHRHSLKNRLKFGNQFSLRKRLTLLIASLPPDVRRMIAVGNGKFIQKVVDTRNHFSHYDPGSMGQVFEGADIHFAGERLSVLLICVLLKDLGVSNRSIREMLRSHARFKYVLSRGLSL